MSDKYTEWACWSTGLQLDTAYHPEDILADWYKSAKSEVYQHLKEIGVAYNPARLRVAIMVQHPIDEEK